MIPSQEFSDGNSTFKLLRRQNRRWENPGSFASNIQRFSDQFKHLHTNIIGAADLEKSSDPKTDQKLKITGVKIAGVVIKQISTHHFAYQNDQRNKLYTLGDFKNKTPTHITVTHAISKSEQNF